MLEKEPALFKIPYFRAFVIIREFSSKEIRPRRLLIIFFRFCIDTIIYTWIKSNDKNGFVMAMIHA